MDISPRTKAVDASPVEADEEGLLAPGDYFFHVPPPPSGSVVTHATSRLDPGALRLPSILPSEHSHAILPHPAAPPSEPTQPSAEVPAVAYCYPVVPFFDSWHFPHDHLPLRWQLAATAQHNDLRPASAAVQERDGTCRLTNCREVTEYAHIIPKSEGDWFARNNLGRKYGSLGRHAGEDRKDDSDNIILLRSDVHTMWDNRDFVLVPKCICGGDDAGLTGRRIAFVAHVLHESTELLALYHNLETQPLAVPKQYFLARLGRAIFPSMKDFLLAGRPRLLTVIDVDTGISETAWYNPAECKALLNSGRRSRSPSKRKRSTGDEAGGGNEHHDVQNHKRAKTWHHEDGDEVSDSGFSELDSINSSRCDPYERDQRGRDRSSVRDTVSNDEAGVGDTDEDADLYDTPGRRRGRSPGTIKGPCGVQGPRRQAQAIRKTWNRGCRNEAGHVNVVGLRVVSQSLQAPPPA
ncbi:hypothetical protein LTR56_026391 [Elasticomyces elasticus]|nr:hypothetical protein LTR56_026391 [Elasticomyces elasticus]